jgi:hypothetical protein
MTTALSTLRDTIADIETLIQENLPVWIWGAPGIGKSDIIKQIAARLGYRVLDIRLSMYDPVDLRGLPMADIVRKVTEWLRPKLLDIAEGEQVIIFLDEMDRAATAVLNAALQLVLDRRVGEFDLPDSVRIVAAGNGDTDARMISKISNALANRFTHLYAVADAETASAHWARIGLDPALVAFIRFRGAADTVNNKPGLLQTTRQPGEHAFASPRSWAKCDKFMSLPDAQRARMVKGTVGAAPALEFEAFVGMFRSLPSLDSIIRDPMGAALYPEINVNYAIAAGLSRKADHMNAGAIITYADRMQREFGIACVSDAARRNPAFCETRAYVDWAARNQDVTI